MSREESEALQMTLLRRCLLAGGLYYAAEDKENQNCVALTPTYDTNIDLARPAQFHLRCAKILAEGTSDATSLSTAIAVAIAVLLF